MRRFVAAVGLVLIVFGAIYNAWAAVPEPRVALVIGNSAYDTSLLKNPANDARLIAETLRDLGFQVIVQTNANQKGMRRLLRDFGEALDDAGPDSVGLFYFSGHGVQVRGENFLIPTDAEIRRESDVKIEAISANEVLNTLSFADNRLNIVILDACRNNPYASAFKSLGRGLARMDAPRGTLVAYSTGPGDVAVDGEGGNSPYTLALSQAMKSPGVPAEKMFKLVRDSVMAATKGQQTPWEESSLTGADFYFKIDVSVTVEAPEASTLSDNAATKQQETAFWQSIQNSTNPGMFDEYLRQFADGTFAGLARRKRDALLDAEQEETRTAGEDARSDQIERQDTEGTGKDTEKKEEFEIAILAPQSQPSFKITRNTILQYSNWSATVSEITTNYIDIIRDKKKERLLFGLIRIGRNVMQHNHRLQIEESEVIKLRELFPLTRSKTIEFKMIDVYEAGTSHIDRVSVTLSVVGDALLRLGENTYEIWEIKEEAELNGRRSLLIATIQRTYYFSPKLGISVKVDERIESVRGEINKMGNYVLRDVVLY